MNASTLALFNKLVGTLGPGERESLGRAIDDHTSALRRAGEASAVVPVARAVALADGLKALLSDASLSPDQHRLVAGAARYYCSEEDHLPDTQTALGLEDDIEVYNYVVRAIGRPDLLIKS